MSCRDSLLRTLPGVLAAQYLTGCSHTSSSVSFADSPRHDDGRHHQYTAVPPHDRTPADDEDTPPLLDENSPLADYLLSAGLHHPSLEAAYQRFQAAAARTDQVGVLPDPRLSFGVFLEEVETAAGPQKTRIGISQTLPWFGKLEGKRDAAARAAGAAWLRYQATKLALFEQVKVAVHELHYLHRAVQITRENLELLKQFEQVARARFRVAATDHPDVIRLQVELGVLEDRVAQLTQLRGPMNGRLNAALDRPINAELPWPGPLPRRHYPGTFEELAARLEESNPDLLALNEEVEREADHLRVARKEGMPDLTFGLDYIFVENDAPNPGFSQRGDDPVLLNVSLNLPLFRDKYQAKEREVEARQMAIASSRSERRIRLGAELREALFEHRDAGRRVELYSRTLIPKATESMQASLGGFRSGESNLLEVLDTERTLLEFQLALERARADRAISLARLERLIGQEVETISSDETHGETP